MALVDRPTVFQTFMHCPFSSLMRPRFVRESVGPRAVATRVRFVHDSARSRIRLERVLGHTSERRWLRFARTHLIGMFPDLPGQSGYNKRLRKLGDTMSWLIGMLGADTSIATDDVWVVDSTLAGYCVSHSRFFWGLRLHLVWTLQGLLREENFSLQGNAKTIDGGLQSLSSASLAPAATLWRWSAPFCGPGGTEMMYLQLVLIDLANYPPEFNWGVRGR